MTKSKNHSGLALLKFLIAVALLSASFAVFSLKQAGVKKDDIAYSKPKDLVFKDLARRFPDVRRVKITTPEGSFQFRNNNGVWQIPERANYPLNTTRLTELANQLASLSVVAVKSNDPGEFDNLGVGEPLEFGFGSIIEFFDSQDQIIDASHIGQKADGIYVRKMGDSKIHLAQGDLMEFTKISQWPDYRFYAIDVSQIKGIYVGQKLENSISYFQENGNFANSPKAMQLAQILTAPKLIDVTTGTRINSKPVGKTIYALTDNSLLTVTIHAQNGNYWLKFKANGENDTQTPFSLSLNERANGWAFALEKEEASKMLIALIQ